MKRILLSLLLFAGVAAAILACLPREPTHVVSQGDFVLTYKLKEKRRIDRITFDFIFSGTITTTGSPQTGVKAMVSNSAAQTVVVDAFLMFPGAVSSQDTPSFDTFSIQQQRTESFDPDALSWTITPLPLVADPGLAGMATLDGVDSNEDGVRDDIERFIELTHPSAQDALIRPALRQNARTLGSAIREAGDVDVSTTNHLENARSIDCVLALIRSQGRPEMDFDSVTLLEAEFLNTPARARAYARYQDDLIGTVGPPVVSGDLSPCT